MRRTVDPRTYDYSPMLNIKTSACPKCSHTFLRYANACPECGFVTRRRKRGRTRARAILASILAVTTACFFISEIPVSENVFDGLGIHHALGDSSPKPAGYKMEGTEKTRKILLREAVMQKMRTSSIYSSK